MWAWEWPRCLPRSLPWPSIQDGRWQLGTLGVFILLDIVVGQLVEPHLYGHATGLSPLSLVVGAIFWSWLWGPAGLILSTPLTLCLLIAGRHMEGLGVLELLLGNAQPLTLPQRFYQRALSGDPHEIIANARAFLKAASLAAYCDRVMIPALHLARLDAETSATTVDQQLKIRRVIVDVIAVLSGNSQKFLQRRDRGAVLEQVDAGRWLRQQREQLTGKWQGPLGVPRGPSSSAWPWVHQPMILRPSCSCGCCAARNLMPGISRPQKLRPGCRLARTPTALPSFFWLALSPARNASASTRSVSSFTRCCRKQISSAFFVPESQFYLSHAAAPTTTNPP